MSYEQHPTLENIFQKPPLNWTPSRSEDKKLKETDRQHWIDRKVEQSKEVLLTIN